MKTAHPISVIMPYFSHLAIWPTAYALGVFLLMGWTLGTPEPTLNPVLYIFLCAHSCYLLDRVKITDARQDPADALALPSRTMLFARMAKPLRALVIVELLAAGLVGFGLHPLLTIIPLAALIVVHLYAGRQASVNSPRLKDLPALKAFIIASGHIALSLAVLWASQYDLLIHLSTLDFLAIFGLWLIVAGDAVLCDIDDHDTDRLYSTLSLAVMLGSKTAWIAAMLLITSGSLSIALDTPSTIGLSATLIISTLLTRHSTNHRDFIDARLLIIVLLWMWISTL